MSLDEFTLISRFFTRPNNDSSIKKGIGDDCAVVRAPSEEDLLFTTDTMNAGIHFFADTPACDLGYKSLAISLSDIAAMGGSPRWFLLNLSLPEADPLWLKEFASGIFELAEKLNLELIGGDTTRGPLAITTQVIGTAPKGASLLRHRAKSGDDIYLTGSVGAAGLAVEIKKHRDLQLASDWKILLQKLNRPVPRVDVGLKIRDFAHAAIDISDGLMGDLGHILNQSQVGASLFLDQIPIWAGLRKLYDDFTAIEFAITTGDDYELCFTAAERYRRDVENVAKSTGVKIHRIGKIESQLGCRTYYFGESKSVQRPSYQHFFKS